jgi:hypothetical protein
MVRFQYAEMDHRIWIWSQVFQIADLDNCTHHHRRPGNGGDTKFLCSCRTVGYHKRISGYHTNKTIATLFS